MLYFLNVKKQLSGSRARGGGGKGWGFLGRGFLGRERDEKLGFVRLGFFWVGGGIKGCKAVLLYQKISLWGFNRIFRAKIKVFI